MRKHIRQRREEVSQLLAKGMKETKIAEKLGVARHTIVRDVAFLKKSSQKWLDELAENGFIFEYRSALEKIRTRNYERKKLYDNTDGVSQKLVILRDMDASDKLYLELLGEGPTIHALRKAIQIQRDSYVQEA